MYARLGRNCAPTKGTALTSNSKYFTIQNPDYSKWVTNLSRNPFCDPLYNQGLQSVEDEESSDEEEVEENNCESCKQN